MPSAGRCCWISGVKLIPLYEAVASTSTGQPGLISPVSTLREKMRCFLVVPPSGVIIASKKSAREAKIDNRRANDAHRIKFGHAEIAADTGRPNIAFPDNAAIKGVERVHIIRFGHGNNHCPAAWAAFDVKRLRINVARNRAVKVQVARQIGGRARRECGINVKTVPRIVIMKLRNVHLCVCCENCAQNGNARFSNDERTNGNRDFINVSLVVARYLLPHLAACLSRSRWPNPSGESQS